MCNMQYKPVVRSLQCSVYSMKCTGAYAGAGAGVGAGAVFSVNTVCIVQCALCCLPHDLYLAIANLVLGNFYQNVSI